MKMTKILNSILAFILLPISIGFAFGQTQDERKLELVVQAGHTKQVQSVAISSDGKLLVSCDYAVVKFWNIQEGRELWTLYSDSSVANISVTLSPNDKSVAIIMDDNTVNLVDAQTGEEKTTFKGHTNHINSIDFTPNGKTLVTSSSDKTIKLWNVETGKLIRTLVGHSDVVTSIKLSPDGKKLASGSFDKTIKLWDTVTGKLIRSIQTTAIIGAVSFNTDGKKIASIDVVNNIVIWNSESGQKIREWEIPGYTRSIKDGDRLKLSIKFSANDQVIAVKDILSYLSFWEIETGKEKNLKDFFANQQGRVSIQSLSKIPPRIYITSFALSPDGKTIAYGDRYKRFVLEDIASGKVLQLWKNYSLSLVYDAISPNGELLALGGQDGSIRIWNMKKRQQLLELPNSKEAKITSLSFSPDSKILASGSDFKGQQNLTAAPFTEKDAAVIDLKEVEKDEKDNILISGVVLWDAVSGKRLRTIGVDIKKLSEGNFYQMQEAVSQIKAVFFSPDGKTLATSSGKFGSFDDRNMNKLWNVNTGQEISYKILPKWLPKPEYFENATTARINNNNIVTNIEDGRIFLYKSDKDEEEFSTLIPFSNNEWALVTPDGRFDASEGALEFMHYSYGLEIIDLEKLKEMYYEPGLLQKLLGYSKEPLRSIVPLKDIKLYPEIVGQPKFDEKTGKLDIKLKNRGGGIGRTEVFVNGKRVVEDARDERLRKNPLVAFEAVVGLTVDLPKESFVKGKSNEIKVITSNYLKEIGKGNIQSRGSAVFYVNREREELPNLYAIVGGVSDYDGDQLDLRFAAKDAEDFSNALRLGANRLFCPSQTAECLGKIDIRTFSTTRENSAEQPTKENFRKAFADIASKAKAEDIVVIYLAGHGVTLGTGTDTYFYLTKEARSASKEDLEKNFQTVAVSNSELTDWLTPNSEKADDIYIKANKQVIILDTCAAGNFAGDGWKTDRDLSGDQIRAMDFLRGKTGTFILMGSAANRPSYEANRYNQGLLTRALLEGMKGLALQPATGNIDVALLFNYAQNRVPEIAKEMSLDQRPIIKTPSGNPFVFGQIADEDKTKISLPALKPMLLRPRLGSGEENDDPLNLVAELRKRFDAESSYELMKRNGKGEPVLIYVDDDSFPGAVRVTGTYTVEGEKVRVKAFLRKDGKTIATIPEIFIEKENIVDELLNAVRNELEKLK